VERDGRVAFHREALAAHFGKKAEDVEHRLIDAIARERTEAGEVRLVLKFERPSQRAFEIHTMFLSEIVFAPEARGGVARIHRAVAIGERGPLACRAAFGV